jgi:hypothetical protein
MVYQFPVTLLVSASYAKRIPIDFPAVFEVMYLLVSFVFCLRLMLGPDLDDEATGAILSK